MKMLGCSKIVSPGVLLLAQARIVTPIHELVEKFDSGIGEA
jgi:hypothetical protein